MKFLPLIWAALWRKPSRTIFTALSIATAFLLFRVLQGIGLGFHALATGGAADRMYADPRFGALMPLAYTEQIAAVPGVRLVAPQNAVGGYYKDPKNGIGINMADERYFAARDELGVSKERIAAWRKIRNGLMIGRGVADRFGLKPGDPFSLHSLNVAQADGSHDFLFEIVDVVEGSVVGRSNFFAIANYEYINDLRTAGKDMANTFVVRITDPTHTTAIAKEIDKLFANSTAPTRTQAERAWSQSAYNSIGDIAFFVNAIVGSVMFMLLFLTTNSIAQSFNERVPELAVLKTIGFGDPGVSGLVIGEAILQCLTGAALGLGIAKIAAAQLRGHVNMPSETLTVPWVLIAAGLLLSIAIAFLSVAVPAWRAARLDVVAALSSR